MVSSIIYLLSTQVINDGEYRVIGRDLVLGTSATWHFLNVAFLYHVRLPWGQCLLRQYTSCTLCVTYSWRSFTTWSRRVLLDKWKTSELFEMHYNCVNSFSKKAHFSVSIEWTFIYASLLCHWSAIRSFVLPLFWNILTTDYRATVVIFSRLLL